MNWEPGSSVECNVCHLIFFRVCPVLGLSLALPWHTASALGRNPCQALLRAGSRLQCENREQRQGLCIQKDRDYIAKKGFEVITHSGEVVTSGPISDEVLARLRAGTLEVRQKPGPSNALGLVKLIFPNSYNVYLHSTPVQELFSRSRRDFSHGCIRVEKPAELTAWVLRNNPGWTLERVREAMQNGKDNQRVNLAKPVPVLILYATAIVDEAGAAHFFDDIYGLDADLEKVLAKGYPYPG